MTPEFEKIYNQHKLNLLNEDEVNCIIKANGLDTNKISDGYHTFGELYAHRIALFIALCRQYRRKSKVWVSKKHSDGSEWDGWFMMGINDEKGKQISYHLPMSEWDDCSWEFKVLDKAPDFDGHTSTDVLERIKNIRCTR